MEQRYKQKSEPPSDSKENSQDGRAFSFNPFIHIALRTYKNKFIFMHRLLHKYAAKTAEI